MFIHKYRSRLVSSLFITLVTITLILAGCGGGGGGHKTTTAPLTINGSVYDSAVPNATVELLVGGTVVATGTTDAQGNYSLYLNTTSAQRALRAVVRARRGKVVLQSLLGNLQTVVNARDSSKTVDQSFFPKAVVSHVTTAVLAVIQDQNGGSLPDDQNSIDNLIDAVTNNTTLQDLVTQIAAAVKAVVDYEADPGAVNSGLSDTGSMADFLAGDAANIAANLTALVSTATGGVTEGDLVDEVQNDPIVAVQLPSTVDNTDITGNYYIIGEDTMLHFVDGTNMDIFDYGTITTGGNPAMWSYLSGVMTITFSDQDGNHTVTATILGGTVNAVLVNIVFDGSNEGDLVMRRMEPVGTIGSNIAESDIVNKIFVNFAGQHSALFPANCNNSDVGWISSPDGTIPMTCSLSNSNGMIIIDPDWAAVGAPEGGNIVLGLLSDAWNNNSMTMNLSSNFVDWELDPFGDPDATIGRGYIGRDSGANPCFTCPMGTDSHPISLRITTPTDTANGVVSLRLLSNDYVDVNTPAEMVIYTDGSSTLREKYNWPAQDVSAAGWPDLVSLSANTNTLASSAGPRLVVNLGTHAGDQLRAVFVVDNLTTNTPLTMTTRRQYNLEEIVAGDISGKTFAFADIQGDGSGTVTFNANNTGSVTESGSTQSFTWSIDADALTDFAYSAAGHQYTTLLLNWPDGSQTVVYRSADLGDGTIIIGMYEKDNTNAVTSVSGGFLTPQ